MSETLKTLFSYIGTFTLGFISCLLFQYIRDRRKGLDRNQQLCSEVSSGITQATDRVTELSTEADRIKQIIDKYGPRNTDTTN